MFVTQPGQVESPRFTDFNRFKRHILTKTAILLQGFASKTFQKVRKFVHFIIYVGWRQIIFTYLRVHPLSPTENNCPDVT